MPNITFDATGSVVRSEGVRVYGGDNLIYINNTNDTWRGFASAFGVYTTAVNVATNGADVDFTFGDNNEAAWFGAALEIDFTGLTSTPIARDGTSAAGVRLGIGTADVTSGISAKAFTTVTNVVTFTATTLAALDISAGTGQRLHIQVGVNDGGQTIDTITGHNDNTDVENTGQPTRFVDYWTEIGFNAHGTSVAKVGDALILSGSSANSF